MHKAICADMLIICNLSVTVLTAVIVIIYSRFKAKKWLQIKKYL